MNLNNKLELIQSQKLVMTTQLKQSLDILNMSSLELEEKIKSEADENPLLEVKSRDDTNWQELIKSADNKYYEVKSYNLDNDMSFENMVKNENNLYEYIKFQLGCLKLGSKEKYICEYIIDCLDENGYLNCDENLIIRRFKIDKNLFNSCLKYIQQLEPNGIGARNLSECLLIQLKNKNIEDIILKSIILQDLELVGKNKLKDISKKYNISIEECVEYVERIRKLNPKPGISYCNGKFIYIYPDVTVKKISDEFFVYLNDNSNFCLTINNYYKDILKNTSDEKAKEFIKKKLNCAISLLENIEARKNTILKIAEIILKEQEDFFNKGIKYIKPLKLKDISLILGYHESTISRGINNKYMMTPFGLFEFKYFFSTSIQSNEEKGTSSIRIKSIIKEFIDKENKIKPLSDDKICKLLNEQGIIISRRTVAKYRGKMDILSSFKRKQFYAK
ncbi:RNA polymerase factor sigma-54 [Terrisporobacter sp.]